MKRIGLALARLLDKLGWFEPEFIEHRFDRQDAIAQDFMRRRIKKS